MVYSMCEARLAGMTHLCSKTISHVSIILYSLENVRAAMSGRFITRAIMYVYVHVHVQVKLLIWLVTHFGSKPSVPLRRDVFIS